MKGRKYCDGGLKHRNWSGRATLLTWRTPQFDSGAPLHSLGRVIWSMPLDQRRLGQVRQLNGLLKRCARYGEIQPDTAGGYWTRDMNGSALSGTRGAHDPLEITGHSDTPLHRSVFRDRVACPWPEAVINQYRYTRTKQKAACQGQPVYVSATTTNFG